MVQTLQFLSKRSRVELHLNPHMIHGIRYMEKTLLF